MKALFFRGPGRTAGQDVLDPGIHDVTLNPGSVASAPVLLRMTAAGQHTYRMKITPTRVTDRRAVNP